MDLVFIALLALYLVVGVKVDKWITCSLIGLEIHTPRKFRTQPRVYDRVRIGIFLLAAAALLKVSFPWYFGAVALAIAWFATTWIGNTLAFNEYRYVSKDLAAHAETEEDRAKYLQDARKSNAELLDMAMFMNKFSR